VEAQLNIYIIDYISTKVVSLTRTHRPPKNLKTSIDLLALRSPRTVLHDTLGVGGLKLGAGWGGELGAGSAASSRRSTRGG
jgi:hypothetical protein